MNTALATVDEPTKNYNNPDHYRCGGCGVIDVRLWRKYNTFLNHQSLYCRECAIKNQKKTPEDIEESLCYGRCDQIGWLVPAVPTRDGSTFWGYTSVPQGLCNWWYSLPNALDDTLPVDQWSLMDVLEAFKLSRFRAEPCGCDGAKIKLGGKGPYIGVRIESAPKWAVEKAGELRGIIERDTTPDGEKQAARYALARLGKDVTARIDGAPSGSVATLRDLGATLAGIADDYNEMVTTQALRSHLDHQFKKNPVVYAGIQAYTDVDLGYRFERRGITICEGRGPIFPMVEYDMQKSSCEDAITHLNEALKISPE